MKHQALDDCLQYEVLENGTGIYKTEFRGTSVNVVYDGDSIYLELWADTAWRDPLLQLKMYNLQGIARVEEQAPERHIWLKIGPGSMSKNGSVETVINLLVQPHINLTFDT